MTLIISAAYVTVLLSAIFVIVRWADVPCKGVMPVNTLANSMCWCGVTAPHVTKRRQTFFRDAWMKWKRALQKLLRVKSLHHCVRKLMGSR
mgnify:CR=1 FL=1